MMKFCVAWISFYDNILHQQYVHGQSMEDAIFNSEQNVVDHEFRGFPLYDLKKYANDADGAISVLRIE